MLLSALFMVYTTDQKCTISLCGHRKSKPATFPSKYVNMCPRTGKSLTKSADFPRQLYFEFTALEAEMVVHKQERRSPYVLTL